MNECTRQAPTGKLPAPSPIRYEWVRVRTLRSTWALVVLALGLLFASALVWAGHHDMTEAQRYVQAFGLAATVASILVAAIGVSAFGGEYQHGTIGATLLTARTRIRVLAAKAVVVGGLGALTGLGMVAVVLCGLVAGGSSVPGWNAEMVSVAGAVVLYVTLSGLVGLAVAGLTRHAMAALAIVIVWPTVVERLIVLVFEVKVGYLPFFGTSALFGSGDAGQWTQVIPLIALTTVLLVANAISLSRRDA
jgi:ABC-2 type transport system permease protein